MTDRRVEERPESPLALAGLFVLGITTVLVVIVVQNDWSETRWAAVNAIAASVQAVAVVGALVYARRQVVASRVLAAERRTQETVDRLAAVAFERVQPPLDRLLMALRGLAWEHDWLNQVDTTADPPEVKALLRQRTLESYEAARVEAQSARDSLSDGVVALRRAFVAAGHERYSRSTHAARLLLGTLMLIPRDIAELDTASVHAEVVKINEAWAAIEKIVTDLVVSASAPYQNP